MLLFLGGLLVLVLLHGGQAHAADLPGATAHLVPAGATVSGGRAGGVQTGNQARADGHTREAPVQDPGPGQGRGSGYAYGFLPSGGVRVRG